MPLRKCTLKPVLARRSPEKVKIKYGICQASAGSYGEWTLRILAKRCGVKPPKLFKHGTARSFFSYPDEIHLSKELYKAPMALFVATCMHEFAHYLDLGQVTIDEYVNRRNKHDAGFVKWLTVVSRAGFCQPDGEKCYPWEREYNSVVLAAAKLGIIKVRKLKEEK
jgi:hypothetical protein